MSRLPRTDVLRGALEDAGFAPDDNVCRACLHHGGDHDLWNRCLVCEDDRFISMTKDEMWAHGIKRLREALK